jgi:hypothetical protein
MVFVLGVLTLVVMIGCCVQLISSKYSVSSRIHESDKSRIVIHTIESAYKSDSVIDALNVIVPYGWEQVNNVKQYHKKKRKKRRVKIVYKEVIVEKPGTSQSDKKNFPPPIIQQQPTAITVVEKEEDDPLTVVLKKQVDAILQPDKYIVYPLEPTSETLPILSTIFQPSTMSQSFEFYTHNFQVMGDSVRSTDETLKQIVRSDESDPKKRYSFHPKFRVTINVITYNRPWSLKRLVKSLLNAHYLGHKVHINFFVDNGSDEETNELVKSFEWPHGNKKILMRYIKAGVVASALESWYPIHEHDYVLIAEDDIEVSKFWYLWTVENIRQYRYPTQDAKKNTLFELDRNIYGISLYTPRESENSIPRFMFYPDKHFNSTTWLHQIPSRWGTVFFPEHWIFFRQYVDMREKLNKNVYIPECECNGWIGSWEKFYTELAYMKGWYVLYPNHNNQTSYSTNHMEPGSYLQATEPLDNKHAYTVPLATENTVPMGRLSDINTLPVLDYKYKQYKKREELQDVSMYSWMKLLKELADAEKPRGVIRRIVTQSQTS